MKKGKFNLTQLSVKSFVTEENVVKMKTVKGGATFHCSDYNCTIVGCPQDGSVPVRTCPDWTRHEICITALC